MMVRPQRGRWLSMRFQARDAGGRISLWDIESWVEGSVPCFSLRHLYNHQRDFIWLDGHLPYLTSPLVGVAT